MNEAPQFTAPQLHRDERRQALAPMLGRIETTLSSALGPESPLAGRTRSLRTRLERDRFQLAVLGQFKRGKSTFVNALLGVAVLPTGVIPLTAVATFIAWGRSPHIRVRFKGEIRSEDFTPQTAAEIRAILFRFVAEEANPENQLGVERVELSYPADILADGTVIIDTPGVGSTLRHNTEAALQVLPECDAAFFVVSADPPITEVELDYLRRLKSKTSNVFYILNKADYLQPEEQRTVVRFLEKVLAEKSLLDASARIFIISARDGLDAKLSGNNQALETSGLAELENHLVRALAGDKIAWLEEAIRRKATDVLAQASSELQLRARALNMPIEQLTAKSDTFQGALHSIENQRCITRDLLAGDHRRLREALDSRIDGLRREVMARVVGLIDASLSSAVPSVWERETRRALSEAMEREFEAARAPLVSTFAADTGVVLRTCQDSVNALADQVRRTAAEIFNVPLGPDIEYEAFELGEDPYWVTESTNVTLIPDPSRLVERLLPAAVRRPRLRARMIRQAEELIVRNAESLRWAIFLGLDDTFRKTIAHFEEQLDHTVAVTRDVIRDALMQRQDRSFAVQPELDRLRDATAMLASLREDLNGR